MQGVSSSPPWIRASLVVIVIMVLAYISPIEFMNEDNESQLASSSAADASDACDPGLFERNLKATESLLKRSDLSDENYYATVLDEQVKACGPLCSNNNKYKIQLSESLSGPVPKDLINEFRYSFKVRTPVSCCDLFSHPIFDAPAERWPPIREIPKSMLSNYTLDGKVKITPLYFNERQAGTKLGTSPYLPWWSKENIEKLIDEAKEGKLSGGYRRESVEAIKKAAIIAEMAGKHILVVGSQTPWVEAALLSIGVRKITTLDYIPLKTDHPQIATITPGEINQLFINRKVELFDGAVSFSSLEHSGLGRYGDLLNPWGDVIAAAKVWCLVKPGGIFALGIPDSYSKDDEIQFNAHRIYGPNRGPLIFSNWDVRIRVDETDEKGRRGAYFDQPVYLAWKEKSP